MLTDAAIRKAKGKDKDYKLSDSGGLYLFVTKSGHRSWRLKYRFAGKEKRLVFGAYPEIGLAAARQMRDDAKRLLREDRMVGRSVVRRRRIAGSHVRWRSGRLSSHDATLLKRLTLYIIPIILFGFADDPD
jgi:hypothetical protein